MWCADWRAMRSSVQKTALARSERPERCGLNARRTSDRQCKRDGCAFHTAGLAARTTIVGRCSCRRLRPRRMMPSVGCRAVARRTVYQSARTANADGGNRHGRRRHCTSAAICIYVLPNRRRPPSPTGARDAEGATGAARAPTARGKSTLLRRVKLPPRRARTRGGRDAGAYGFRPADGYAYALNNRRERLDTRCARRWCRGWRGTRRRVRSAYARRGRGCVTGRIASSPRLRRRPSGEDDVLPAGGRSRRASRPAPRNLSFEPAELDKCSSFCGSLVMRIGLARLLLSEPEHSSWTSPPTTSTRRRAEWLVEYTRSAGDGTVLSVPSHDQERSRRAADSIAEVRGWPSSSWSWTRKCASIRVPRGAASGRRASRRDVDAMGSAMRGKRMRISSTRWARRRLDARQAKDRQGKLDKLAAMAGRRHRAARGVVEELHLSLRAAAELRHGAARAARRQHPPPARQPGHHLGRGARGAQGDAADPPRPQRRGEEHDPEGALGAARARRRRALRPTSGSRSACSRRIWRRTCRRSTAPSC